MGSTRKINISYIKDNIADVDDSDIDTMYNKMIEYVPNKDKKKKLSRMDKVLHINSNLLFVENDNLESLKDIVFNSLNHIETENEKKERITLEIVNKIFEVNGLEKINKLTEFVHIRRDIIVNDETNKVIDDNKEYIFNNGFNKVGCKIYHTYIKTPQFSILKGMLKEIGYEMKSKLGSKTKDKVREGFMIYTIFKK
jgi:hypothetical protein